MVFDIQRDMSRRYRSDRQINDVIRREYGKNSYSMSVRNE